MISDFEMDEEIFETEIGIFKIQAHPLNEDLISVKTKLPIITGEIWEDMGYMKKKDFFKLIKDHNPVKLQPLKEEQVSSDSFWDSYASL